MVTKTELMERISIPSDTIEEMNRLFETVHEENLDQDLEKTAEKLINLPDDEDLYEKLFEEKTKEWALILSIHEYTAQLLVLLECWRLLYLKYEEQNIPEEIYFASAHDLTCKVRECRKVYGIHGIFVGFWYHGFFQMTRFALGRLQFELIPYPFKEAFIRDGIELHEQDPVINMHIPSEGPLTTEKADNAFSQAKQWFPEGKAFFMESWLLDTDLMKLYPEGNLKVFTSRFEVVHVKKAEKFEDGWRVFDKDWENAPADLPTDTRLRKNVAAYLSSGGKLGEGYGVLLR